MAEDDPHDRLLFERAFNELQSRRGEVRFVEDGKELMEYLRRRGEDGDPELFPKHSLIFMDLNIPKKDAAKLLSKLRRTQSY
jgi:two-component system, response regulator